MELKDRISHRYDSISTHVPFSISKKSKGEVDIFAVKGKSIDLYEVKCSHRITKAKKQLKRARKHIGHSGNSYFYCGSSGMLTLL
jgi:hypothetical protein